jgi:hypothetical protein
LTTNRNSSTPPSRWSSRHNLSLNAAAIEKAVEAAAGLAKADKKGGPSFGFKLGSPEPGPGEQGMPKGVQETLVFTYHF